MKKGKLYEKQPYDTSKSWAAFVDYLDMELPRTLESLHAAYMQPACRQSKKNPTNKLETLKGWYRSKEWKRRAALYDKEQADDLIGTVKKESLNRDLSRVVNFVETAYESGKSGLSASQKIKKAITDFVDKGMLIETLDDAYKASRIVIALEPSSLEMLAKATGVEKILEQYEVETEKSS